MCTLIAIYIFNIYIASGNETIVVGIKQNERCIHRGNICSIPANRYYKSRVPSKVIELALTAGCYVESIKAMNKRYGYTCNAIFNLKWVPVTAKGLNS